MHDAAWEKRELELARGDDSLPPEMAARIDERARLRRNRLFQFYEVPIESMWDEQNRAYEERMR